jgi:hypothetical protein
MDAGDVWIAAGPFSTTFDRPLLKSTDLSFILPIGHRPTHGAVVLAPFLGLLLSPDSESEPRTIKRQLRNGSLVLPPATEQPKQKAIV